MNPENPLLGDAGVVGLALAAALLRSARDRRLAGAGLLTVVLALAAWRVGSPSPGALTPPSRLGHGFLVGNGGLLLLGMALAAIAALREPPGPLRIVARLLTGAGVVLLAPALAEFAGGAGPVRTLAASVALALTGVTLAVGARAVAGGPVGVVVRRLAPPPLVPVFAEGRGARRWIVLLAAGAAAAASGPHVALGFAGLVAAAWAGYFAFRAPGARPVPVAPVLTLLLLPAYGLLATISGPLGLRIATLAEVPLSPAAGLLVSPVLLVVAWAVVGLWPLQRQLPGALLAPVGLLLLGRVALPLAAEGLAYWQPVTLPLAVLGLWNAAAWGRWPLLAAGGGFLGAAVATPVGIAPAAGLTALGLALELASLASVPRAVTTLVRALAWPLAAVAGLGVLEAGLRGEVVYTALGTLGLALIIAAGGAGAAASRPR